LGFREWHRNDARNLGTLHTLRDGSQHLFPRIGQPKQRDDERARKVAASQSDLIASRIATRI